MSTKRSNGWSLLLVFGVLLTLSLGCSQIQKLRAKKDPVKSGPVQTQPEGSPEVKATETGTDEGLSEKTNIYIGKCFNPYSNRVRSSYQRYASWLKDVKAGPTGKESLVYGLYDVNGDGQDCIDAIAQAKEMEPDIPEAEAAADEYSAALKEVIGQIRGIYSYYDQEDYRDDNFQKGKEAHPSLLAAFDKFEGANKKFADELDKLETQVAEKKLTEYKDDPAKKFEYAVTNFNIKAKKVSNYAQRTPYESMKAEDLQPLNDELDTTLAAMKAEGSSRSMASTYFGAGDELLKASKGLMRRLRDKKPFTSTERGWLGTDAGWMVEDSPDKVIYSYNNLIQLRTTLSF